MRILTVPFLSSAEFLSHFSEKNGDGALFCRTRTELEPDEQVLLEISFPGLPNRALVRGSVVTRVAGRGSWVAFDAADSSTRDFLVGIAQGQLAVTAVERAHDRFPAELPVAFALDDGVPAESQTADVSASGAFIRCAHAEGQSGPAVGTRVKLTLAAGSDAQPLELQGEVTRAKADGFAVQFEPRSGENNRRLRALLRRASETGRIRFVQAES
jgi:hypothetical protein